MGQTALLPFQRRRAEDFFALKNPTTSAGVEPANLGTKGQHATSRPLDSGIIIVFTSCLVFGSNLLPDSKEKKQVWEL